MCRVGAKVRGEDDARHASKTNHDTPDGAHPTARRPASDDENRHCACADAPLQPMTKRTQRDPNSLDVSPLIRTIQYLDEVLKRGVVIGVYQDSMEVSDADVHKALTAVRSAMEACNTDMERCMRGIVRFTGQHEAPGALQ